MRCFSTSLLAVLGLSCLAPSASSTGILFLVAENPALISPCFRCDSYVLPLSDPDDIAAARAIIATGGVGGPGMGVIVVASIAAGADGINRDLLAPGTPEWSWHVTEFLEFAEGVTEILDGSPGTVENDVAGWIANTNGRIGFTNYTVVQELPEPTAGWLLLVGGAILVSCRTTLRGTERPRRGPTRVNE